MFVIKYIFYAADAAIAQEACPNRTIRDPWPQSTKSFLAKDRNKVRNQHIDDMGVVTHTTAGWSYFEVNITHSKLYDIVKNEQHLIFA
jgi:hypothetical protein